MRAPRNEATGTSGESEVLAQFERLGWGGLIDSRHDTGTDLYLRPRDARRFELGVVMGVQVKTGPSHFTAPKRDAQGDISGWWFAEDNRNHFDYWLRHALPHLLILRDQNKEKSFWVHVTPERVVSTGKGAKIFVPASQTVDVDHNQALSEVALTQLETSSWEGTAWTGAVNLSSGDEIRYALITPRLIAPHPNLGPRSITGLEALAMQVLLRTELERTLAPKNNDRLIPGFDDQWQGLSLDEAGESEDWCWRATAALHLRLYNGETTAMTRLTQNAPSPSERAASVILACTVHFEENDPDAALQILNDALQHDDYSPVDHAWLETHRARALLETGRHEEAFDLAMRAQRIHREAPHDLTGTAISGACASTSFRAAGWLKGDIANIIQGSDNPVSWWRAQLMSYGLANHLSEEFRAWTETGQPRTQGSGTAHRRLMSAALLASLAGDHEGWRGATGSLAEMLLIANDPTSSPQAVSDQLTLLRLSGDSRGVSSATHHVALAGPPVAARLAAGRVDLSRSTRTSALADLELLTAAGDTLEEDFADEVCTWALATLSNPEEYLVRTRPTFAVTYKIIYLLRSMLWSMSDASVHRVIEYFLNQPAVSDGPTAETFARLIRAIPETVWTDDERRRAAERRGDAPYLREAYLRVAVRAAKESREELHRRARAGELIILEAVDDVRTLSTDAVAALVERLSDVVHTDIRNAAIGFRTSGGLDAGRALTMLNVWHPSTARWDAVESLLSDPNLAPEDCLGTLEVLAVHGSGLSSTVKKRLLERLAPLREGKVLIGDLEHDDARSLAAEAFAALTDDLTRKKLVRELLGGDALHRSAGARVIERFGGPSDADLLLVLAGDANETVRNPALAGLAAVAVAGHASAPALTLLRWHLQSGGKRSASAIASRLPRNSTSPTISELLKTAARHPSARVRSAARSNARR
ncbi:DUF4365 domain-containing protein [Arthrobacter sp. NPDC058130]|uniref:DUF4365 domain-containing protein n=1 Tax=Arthrobacter sp. NPDC058130 TaxID=3346353 RepID=UPI0036E9B018